METFFIVYILISLGFGFICQRMAKARGRRQTLGFWLGFIFGFWAVLVYAVAGDSKILRAYKLKEIEKQYNEESKIGSKKSKKTKRTA